jgi:WD40-like Beta Propeller Repeat
VRDLVAHRTERVSVSTGGAQQNKSVIPPFTQISDISSDGRYVVFDSDSTNLTPRDLNRHTDVFLRDRQKGTTTLVSASSVNVEGDNDSFAPTLTPNGRYLAFESFASNLAPHDPPREDVFVRDLRQGTTTLLDVASDGSPRGPELVKQLLQRVALSADARVAAFASSAANLSPDDSNGLRDLFVRVLDPPRGKVTRVAGGARRPVVTLSADDPAARDFVCRVDVGAPFLCSAGQVRLPLLRSGRHRFSARAGGPGMLFDPRPVATTVVVDSTGPRVRIAPLSSGRLRVVRGTASDDFSGVAKVEVAMVAVVGPGRCTDYNGRRVVVHACRRTRIYVPAHGTRHWSLRVPAALVPAGKPALVAILARARDRAGNLGHSAQRFKIVR